MFDKTQWNHQGDSISQDYIRTTVSVVQHRRSPHARIPQVLPLVCSLISEHELDVGRQAGDVWRQIHCFGCPTTQREQWPVEMRYNDKCVCTVWWYNKWMVWRLVETPLCTTVGQWRIGCGRWCGRTVDGTVVVVVSGVGLEKICGRTVDGVTVLVTKMSFVMTNLNHVWKDGLIWDVFFGEYFIYYLFRASPKHVHDWTFVLLSFRKVLCLAVLSVTSIII